MATKKTVTTPTPKPTPTTVIKEEVEVMGNEMAMGNKMSAEKKKTMQDDFLNVRVPFMAMKDNDKYKDDIVVSVNGKAWQIKRGMKVMIPRYVLYAIEDAERQKMSAADTSQKFENQYKDNVKMNMM